MTIIEQLLDKAAYCVEPVDRADARQKLIQRFSDLEKVVELALEYVPKRHWAFIRTAKEKAVNGSVDKDLDQKLITECGHDWDD